MRKSLFGVFLLSLLMVTATTPAIASIKVGDKCSKLGAKIIEQGFRFTCVKAPRSASNLLGKKLIWSSGVKVNLESLKSSTEILGLLNTLGYGYFSKGKGNGFAGTSYVSNYPCLLYMSPNKQDFLNYWNYNVNTMFYRGKWVAIQSQRWVVNDVSDDGKCIEYFAFKYGGRIYSQ
jgi:hypothetical protein